MKITNILIVGNKGKYGHFFTQFFSSLEYQVRGIDKGDPHEEAADWAEVILFSVRPIKALLAVMEKLLPRRLAGQLWIEIASRKDRVAEFVRNNHVKNVLSIHPMRRPPADGMNLRGSNVVLTGKPVEIEWISWVSDFLKQLGGEVTFTDTATHEKLVVTYGQAVPHDLLLLLVSVLWKRGIDLPKLLSVSSPVFKILISLSARMLQGDAGLYAELQVNNSHAVTMLSTLEALSRRLREMIAKGDSREFEREFVFARNYIGDAQLKELAGLSEKLVETVSPKTEKS
ncbi:MAG: prephenate dehydrogenase/arogenate dehydrogenase family protein [Candidatus Taylorbacteria bacterium]|nr:prephenate dehydrogenase/arogenate dehydrogenase family protein [Candidatus Taylorbacteria bacterium]